MIRIDTSLRFGASCLCLVSTLVHAQSYPTKPIRVVIPFATGGATDVPGRILIERLSDALKLPIVIENRPGAGSTIGASVVAKAMPDGYTLLLTSTTHVMGAHLYKSLPYHALNDFTPLMQIGVAPSVLVAHPSLPVRSVKDLVALAKARPDQIDFASSGVGTAQHMFAELFQMLSGIRMRHIPYQGAAPSADVISGRVQVWFPGMALALPHIRIGRLKPLATTGAQRSKGLPDVPTMAEAGVKEYDAELWHGVLAPKGVPAEIVARLHGEMAKVLRLPEVQNRFLASGNDVAVTTAEQFAAILKSDFEVWGRVVKQSGASLN
jgi:tripartite-type tricarboxylate transporter receptor subunit TctC